MEDPVRAESRKSVRVVAVISPPARRRQGHLLIPHHYHHLRLCPMRLLSFSGTLTNTQMHAHTHLYVSFLSIRQIVFLVSISGLRIPQELLGYN